MSGDVDQRMERLKMDGDLRDAYVELLSAQCAIDRLRLRYTPQDVAKHGSSFMVARSISAAMVICEYFSSIQKSFQPQAGPPPPSKHEPGKDKRF